MAASDVDLWIPEEQDGPVLTKINATSVVEVEARQEPMSTVTKKVYRDGGVDFEGATQKGGTIAEDDGDVDSILLTARKLTRIVRLNDEDVEDTSDTANVITQKQQGWATAYGIGFDNATLAVTAAENGTTIPFTSLYRVLKTTDAGLPDGVTYTAGDNVVIGASGSTGGARYTELSNTFGKLEQGNYWSDADMIAIAHPAFRKFFRGLVDTQGRPIFQENSTAAAGGFDILFGTRIRWTTGARTSAVSTNKPTGRPLLFVGNKQFLIKGNRSGPEYAIAGPNSGAGFTVDQTLLKFRTRRGFGVGNPFAWAMYEAAADQI
jgi:HK97 family phage major capsid protein